MRGKGQDNVGVRKYPLDEQFFDRLDRPEVWYVIGLWQTDGCVSFDHKGQPARLVLSLQADDAELVEQVQRAFGTTKPLYFREAVTCSLRGKPIHSRNCSLQIYSRYMAERLIDLGVPPRKTGSERWIDGPPEMMPHYARGCLDGDGSFCNGKCAPEVALSGSEHMCRGFAAWVNGLLPVGLHGGVNVRWADTCWRARLTGGEAVKHLLRLIYKDATINLARKRVVADALLAREVRPIIYRPDLTAQAMIEARHHLGSWRAVGRAFGMQQCSIANRVRGWRLNVRYEAYAAAHGGRTYVKPYKLVPEAKSSTT